MELTPKLLRQIRRVVRVLYSHDWYSREAVKRTLDANADYTAIRGIGKRLAPVLQMLMLLDKGQWVEATGLAYYEPQHAESKGDGE